MNRLAFNLIYWPCSLLSLMLIKSGAAEVFVIAGILAIVCLVVAGFRIKALNRSLWNLIWLAIPLVAFFYALWLGITTNKK